jgi:hypothetical protein
VHHADQPPLISVRDGAERRPVPPSHPSAAEEVEAFRLRGADRQQADTVAAGERRPDGGSDGGHGDIEQWVRIRTKVQSCIDEVPRLGLAADRVVGGATS